METETTTITAQELNKNDDKVKKSKKKLMVIFYFFGNYYIFKKILRFYIMFWYPRPTGFP